MNPSMRAAVEINDLWRKCILGEHPDKCPTNRQIAEIIEKHMTKNKEDKNRHA